MNSKNIAVCFRGIMRRNPAIKMPETDDPSKLLFMETQQMALESSALSVMIDAGAPALGYTEAPGPTHTLPRVVIGQKTLQQSTSKKPSPSIVIKLFSMLINASQPSNSLILARGSSFWPKNVTFLTRREFRELLKVTYTDLVPVNVLYC